MVYYDICFVTLKENIRNKIKVENFHHGKSNTKSLDSIGLQTCDYGAHLVICILSVD